MADQQVSHEEVLGTIEEERSVYSVLATYINNAEKDGLYVKGYIDGENAYQTFMQEFNNLCRTKFIIRTSWSKMASSLPRRSRYGKEERLYWEFNSGNLEIPFFGVPFVARSCLTKHCQFGAHYYKSTAQRISKQYADHQTDPSVPPPEVKRRRNKPSKKRNCPAIMHIREVVVFPEYGLDTESLADAKVGKYHLRQEKSKLLLRLKDAIAAHKSLGTPINCISRYYVNLPLPEVHIGHPQPCGGIAPTIHPSVTEKIDELISMGIYDARHVRIIVNDYVHEVLLKQDNTQVYQYNVLLYPSECVIADYIYMCSITIKPKGVVAVEKGDKLAQSGLKGEVSGSISELMDLIQNCQCPEALAEAKSSMEKIIRTVKGEPPSPKKKRRKTSPKKIVDQFETLNSEENIDDDMATKIVIIRGQADSDNSNELPESTAIRPMQRLDSDQNGAASVQISRASVASSLETDLSSDDGQLAIVQFIENS